LNVQVNKSAIGQDRIVNQTDWGTSFSREFNTNETVMIEARVKPGVNGVSFTGWSGAPVGSSGNPITLKMDRSYSITAEFKDTQKPVIGELSVTTSSMEKSRFVPLPPTISAFKVFQRQLTSLTVLKIHCP
jgi:hypothetical protein